MDGVDRAPPHRAPGACGPGHRRASRPVEAAGSARGLAARLPGRALAAAGLDERIQVLLLVPDVLAGEPDVGRAGAGAAPALQRLGGDARGLAACLRGQQRAAASIGSAAGVGGGGDVGASLVAVVRCSCLLWSPSSGAGAMLAPASPMELFEEPHLAAKGRARSPWPRRAEGGDRAWTVQSPPGALAIPAGALSVAAYLGVAQTFRTPARDPHAADLGGQRRAHGIPAGPEPAQSTAPARPSPAAPRRSR